MTKSSYASKRSVKAFHYLWRLGRRCGGVHTRVVPAHGGVYARANTRYLPRLGAAVLLARRPTLVLPLARAALANFARAAACFLVAVGVNDRGIVFGGLPFLLVMDRPYNLNAVW